MPTLSDIGRILAWIALGWFALSIALVIAAMFRFEEAWDRLVRRVEGRLPLP